MKNISRNTGFFDVINLCSESKTDFLKLLNETELFVFKQTIPVLLTTMLNGVPEDLTVFTKSCTPSTVQCTCTIEECL